MSVPLQNAFSYYYPVRRSGCNDAPNSANKKPVVPTMIVNQDSHCLENPKTGTVDEAEFTMIRVHETGSNKDAAAADIRVPSHPFPLKPKPSDDVVFITASVAVPGTMPFPLVSWCWRVAWPPWLCEANMSSLMRELRNEEKTSSVQRRTLPGPV
ncbi:hypothetical protein AKJ16_DCAP15267 [Drosera capensis]